MATPPRTPGVFTTEPSLPASVVGVATAIPAFIGFTEKAALGPKTFTNVPVLIESMDEYAQYFGGPSLDLFRVATEPGEEAGQDLGPLPSYDGLAEYHLIRNQETRFNLYRGVRHFYANGGGDCYIISCANYQDPDGRPNPLSADALIGGLDAIAGVTGPTILAVPDAVLLPRDQYDRLVEAMLRQCGERRDRVALFDMIGGDDPRWKPTDDPEPIALFRETVGSQTDCLRYGIAYFPFLDTNLVDPSQLSIRNFDPAHHDMLQAALRVAVRPALPAAEGTIDPRAAQIESQLIDRIGVSVPEPSPGEPALAPGAIGDRELLDGLVAAVPAMAGLLKRMAAAMNRLPASPAMAGIYATNDRERGVWNAPANVGINAVVGPVVEMNDDTQKYLNLPADGIAVNAIRTLIGRGPLVWGARTLDGQSNDWRYIHVSRTMIYIEQSVKLALENFVFAPNSPTSWVSVTAMIESFLHGLWAAGGLMGAKPSEAYRVQCGLGSTMTPDDLIEGWLTVEISLQIVHPAQFIQLVFRQQMLGES